MVKPKLSLHLKLDQRLLLTQSMQQAFQILLLPQADLHIYMLGIIEQNPLLVWQDTAHSEGWDMESFAEGKPSLFEHLMGQVRLNLAEDKWEAAELIIGNLDTNGFFQGECDLEILRKIQSFDPVGIAAANVQDSLIIQLTDKGDSEGAIRLIRECYNEWLKGAHEKIMKRLGVTQIELTALLERVRLLNPYPGRGFAPHNAPSHLPDLIFTETEGWETPLPLTLHLQEPQSLEKLSKEEKRQMNEWRSEARFLNRALHTRSQTLLKIGELIYRHNPSFFEGEKREIAPLKIRDTAEMLSLSESTISRALQGKTLSTPFGHFLLKDFFNQTAQPKQLLQQLIRDEGSNAFSDEELVQKLKEMGISLSRRCISKYRKELNIANSHRRQRKHT